MKSRLPLAAVLVACLLGATTARAAPQFQGRQVSVQADDVQHYLASSFPRTHDALGGLLELTVSHPQLALPPGNRLNLSFELAVATAGGAPAPVGNVALSSALRYDTARQGFFLEQPSIDDFRPARAGAELDTATRSLLNAWLADYARKQPIYRLDPAIAGALGQARIESAGVQDGRLVVRLDRDIASLLPPSAPPGG